MALKVSEVLASVRATLDYPPPDKLKPQLVLLKMREKVDHYFNMMSLTDRNWFLDSDVINAQPNTDEYSVDSMPQFGRPILVETQDLSDPQHVRRSIQVIDLQDRELFYEGPLSAGVATGLGLKHTATTFTFFSRKGSKIAKITPQPSIAADYIVWYEPNRPLPAGLAQNLSFLEQFNNLLIADLSLCLIPYCQYTGEFKQDLVQSLTQQVSMYGQTFEEYIQNDRQQHIQRKLLWGDDITASQDQGWY